ncbi:MAG: hypothetical protein ACQEVA_01085 [Myxococcota bacterium]
MTDGSPLSPKMLRGAFITFEQNPVGIDVGFPVPLMVPFRLNPTEQSRQISVSYGFTGSSASETDKMAGATSNQQGQTEATSLGGSNGEKKDKGQSGKKYLQRNESISFDLILDATDRMEDGEGEFAEFPNVGVLPELSALEMLTQPQLSPGQAGALADTFSDPFSSDEAETFLTDLVGPTTLLVWGHHRVMPCNITSLTIVEKVYTESLVPIRAEVSASCEVLQVWELGDSLQNWLGFGYTEAIKRLMAVFNYRDVADVANSVIPM